MTVQIQLRRGTASEWSTANPTLASGEMGVETDTGRFKVGNGSTPWNALPYSSGPAGPTGPQGATGPQGDPGGATGATGATGVGTTGATGVQGPIGPSGATGPVGIGTTGATGIQGPTGVQGATGAQGNTGATGAIGPQGVTGATGAVGVTGPQGATGVTGDTGATGPQGNVGVTGATGPQGAVGVTGATGVAGNTVLNGSIAPTAGVGVNGDFYINTTNENIYGPKVAGAWPPGVSLIGATGVTGAQGVTGPTGVAGPQGATGVVGVTGATGPQGVTGATGVTGAGGALGYYGSFFDTNATQTAANTTTEYPIKINTTAESNGVRIVNDPSGNPTLITFDHAGTYNIQYSIQFTNTDSSIHNVNVWLRKNDTGATGNVADSNSRYAIVASHGSVHGQMIAAINYVMTLAAGDYLQLMWQTESTQVYLETIPAGTTPATPVSPSIILTAQQVMYTQLGPSGATGPIGPTGPIGVTGPTGVGTTGATGVQGPTGPQGVTGPTGPTPTITTTHYNSTSATNVQGGLAIGSTVNQAVVDTDSSGSTNGITLPTGASGMIVTVTNLGPQSLNVYPASTARIYQASATNSPVLLIAGDSSQFVWINSNSLGNCWFQQIYAFDCLLTET